MPRQNHPFLTAIPAMAATAIGFYAFTAYVGWNYLSSFFRYVGAPWVRDVYSVPEFARAMLTSAPAAIAGFSACTALYLRSQFSEKRIAAVTSGLALLAFLSGFLVFLNIISFRYAEITLLMFFSAFGCACSMLFIELTNSGRVITPKVLGIIYVAVLLGAAVVPRWLGQAEARYFMANRANFPSLRLKDDEQVWQILRTTQDKFIVCAACGSSSREYKLVEHADAESIRLPLNVEMLETPGPLIKK